MARNKSDAESIFRKSEEEMSDMERMMAEILGEQKGPEAAESPKKEPSPQAAAASPVPPARQKKAPEKQERAASHASAASSAKAETKPAKKKKKKKKGFPVGLLLAVIVLLVIGVLVYSKVLRDLPGSMPGAASNADNVSAVQTYEPDVPTDEETAEMAEVSFPPDMVFPTPEPEESLREDGTIKAQPPAGSIVIMSGTEDQETAAAEGEGTGEAVEHRYEFYTEDVSWTEAQQRCLDKGGHLAVISNEDELSEVIQLAAANGIQKVWIGCHRENGELVWENGETVDYYVWGKGEPSLIDSGDNVSEDYLLLWYFNGSWVYNDSRNDPVRDYPAMYSGQIGYVCEYGA